MWPRTDFLDLLGIVHPVVQAPMSGFTPPALVTAVCNAGGLGSVGCVGQPRDVVREQVATVRQATNRPFNLNFFVHRSPQTNPAATAQMRAKLAPYFDEYGLGPVPDPKDPFPTFDAEQLDLVLELRPRVVSFHFGLPETAAVRRLKGAGCIILSSATTVAEARSLKANGAEVIIAQGFEAGGHRGSFTDSAGTGMVGTMALVPQNRRCCECTGDCRGRHRRRSGHRSGFRPRCERGPDGYGFLGLSGSYHLAASPRSTAGCHRRRHRADACPHRPPGPRYAQPLRHGDGGYRTIGFSAASQPRRPSLATAGRDDASRLHASLGGSGCSVAARTAGCSTDRRARGRSPVDHTTERVSALKRQLGHYCAVCRITNNTVADRGMWSRPRPAPRR